MRYTVVLALAAATRSLAQGIASGNYSSSLDMELETDVDDDTKARWCQAQWNTCHALCDEDTDENSCDNDSLEWECECASNSSTPGLEYYTQTVPTFICEELFKQCQLEEVGDSRGQDACEQNIQSKCGTEDPPAPQDDDDDDDDETSTTAEATTSTTTGGGSDATGDDVTTTESDDLAAPTLMPGNGAAAVAAIGVLAYLI